MGNDFWLTSGWHLLARDDHGHMVPNADFMRAYFMREEVAPEDGSCPAELALHKRLIDDPFTAVVPTDLFDIADKDVVQHLESQVIHWTRQIKEVVNNQDNAQRIFSCRCIFAMKVTCA